MGYLLRLHAGDLGALQSELAGPTLRPDGLARPDTVPAGVVANWDLLAGSLAEAVERGGGRPEGALVHLVLGVIDQVCPLYASLHHSSSGGAAFREEFLAGPVSDLLGTSAVDHLVARPLAGLVSPELPSWGHLTADEVDRVAERDLAVDPGSPDAQSLQEVVAAFRRAAEFHLAIIGVYG